MMGTPTETVGPAEPDARPPPDPPDEPDGTDEVEELAEAYDFEENSRKWLRAIAGFLEHYSTDSAIDNRVQYALDMAAIAACERASRILRSDLPPVEP